ncbi:MAG TPA: glycosyltransferase family 39 protein [Verrucomicrobiae bacterium]|nr:glycosyltransferase family 39 protein [Verrucomicrobiae bacterium]
MMNLQVSRVVPRLAEKKIPRWNFWLLLAILSLGFALRIYRITGWILNNDETHFLIQALHPGLLVTNQYPYYYGRPDCLYVLLQILSVHLLGPNELALKIWTVLFGTLSIAAVAILVRQLTDSPGSALWAAALLAVFPLHVFFSTKVTPEVIADFFLICGLIQLVHISWPDAPAFRFALFGGTMALAILSKLTALAFWFPLLLVLPLVVTDRRRRLWGYLSLVLALLPVLAMVVATKLNGGRIHFFEEPNSRAGFGLSYGRIGAQLVSFWRFYAGLVIPLALGGWILLRKRRDRLPLMLPLALAAGALLIAVPFFRVNIRELVFLIPALWPILGFSVAFFSRSAGKMLALGGILVAYFVLTLIGVPGPEYGLSWSDRSTAVLDRPAGWPSREITAWMANHMPRDDALLVTGFGYTDPLVLSFDRLGIRYFSAPSSWELLRDPANRIKYVVFVDDASRYAPTLYHYARTHFTRIHAADFTGYMIFDCQKRSRFVAYPDALNSPTVYANQGYRHAERGDYAAAINCFVTALRQDDSMEGVKRMLMKCYLAKDQKIQALQIGRELIAESPKDADVGRNLAVLYYELGKFDDGLAQCRQNIQLGIFPGVSYGVMGQILEKRGKLEAAKDAYEKSFQLDPNNPVIRDLVGKFYEHHPQLYEPLVR